MTRPNPELVSVVIPAFNVAPYLGQQLESLTRQDYQGAFEVIVADNGSGDDTVGVAEGFRARLDLRVVDASTSRGAGPARNAGFEAARGELLAFADSDDMAGDIWLRQLVAAARDFDLVGGPYEYESLNSPTVQTWRPHQPADRLPVLFNFLPYALGGNCAIWSDVCGAVGGFRAGTSNDVEFSWRVQLAGFRLGFAAEAVMHHRHRSTLRSHAHQAFHFGQGHCRVYRQFRQNGVPRHPQRRRILGMGKCLLRGPWALVSRQRRGLWIQDFTYRLGRARGSLRYRVMFF